MVYKIINIFYSLADGAKSYVVYKIIEDNGKIEDTILQEDIKGLTIIKCYVSSKEYEKILKRLEEI